MHLWKFPTRIAQKPRLHFFTNFFTKAQKLGQATKLGEAKTQPRSIPFATKLFIPQFLCICDNSPRRLLQNHDFTFSPILLPRHKKPIHPTSLSETQPRSIPFATKILTPHFGCICDNSPPILLINHDFTFSPILLPSKQKPSNQTSLSQTQQRSIPFATKPFTPHFGCICDNSPARLLKHHDFTFSSILLPTHKN